MRGRSSMHRPGSPAPARRPLRRSALRSSGSDAWRAGPHGAGTTAAVLALFVLTFTALSVRTLTQTSATWDEPIHLTAGHAALHLGDHRVDPSHPPLVRAWAAVPTVFMRHAPIEPHAIDPVPPERWLREAYRFSQRFLYERNDADRLLYAARIMIVALGVVTGIVLFLWARAWLGFGPAVVTLAFYTFEPNVLAHAALVTTDFGVTCFIFASIYCLWRLHRGGGWPYVAGVAATAALAVASKFSGLLVVPIVALLLGVAIWRGTLAVRRCAVIASLVAAAVVVAIWASYGFRYLPSTSRDWSFSSSDTGAPSDARVAVRMAEWVDERHLLPNAFTQGALYTHVSAPRLPGYLAGEISDQGWWYYLPAAVLLKTPLPLIVLTAIGFVLLFRRSSGGNAGDPLFAIVPVAVYLAAAMASGISLGLRHVLPIYPFLLLVAGVAVRHVLDRRRAVAIATLAVAGAMWAFELGRAYPHTLTFFNTIAGGPGNGHLYLSDSNLAWGQSLKRLKGWMDRNGVAHVNLAYFGQADPAYYGIDCTYLPGGPAFALDAVAPPRLPGYVAISATVLSGVYAQPWERLLYQPFHDLVPVAVVGNAMRVYWVDRWPESGASTPPVFPPEVHRQLADALLFGFAWSDRAALHYETYLRAAPRDAAAHLNHGLALIASERADAGLAALRRAVEIDGNHGPARLTLARALFGAGDLPGTAQHAERAALLLPNDAGALHMLGRVRAVQGRLHEAAALFERALDADPRHGGARRDLDHLRGTAMTR